MRAPRRTGPQAGASKKKYKAGNFRYRTAGYGDWLTYVRNFTAYIDHDQYSHTAHGLALDWYPPYQREHQNDAPLSGTTDSSAHRHLYVLDAEDLDDFTSDDLVQAWAARSHTCGSIEAAAELYALYRVLVGVDETYAGAKAYLDHPDVVAIFAAPAGQEQAVQAVVSSPADVVVTAAVVHAPALALASLNGLTVDQLKAAWANRPDSFASLEAAAETLAILRSLSAATPERPSYTRMMQHELILDLADTLPLEVHQERRSSPSAELALMHVDKRVTRAQATVIRTGQVGFRTAMLERFGGECCVTGCRIDPLLEAAHIVPYRGDQSDDPTNGLLLRVDLHRLFDAHLLTINPKTFVVEVSRCISDPEYSALGGRRLFTLSPKPRGLFIEAHYLAFQKAERGRPS